MADTFPSKYMNKKKTILSLALAILLPQVIGGIGAIATASSIKDWFKTLRKPSWNPPNQIFAPVWTVLYLLMGIASWRVWRHGASRPKVRQALSLYGLQLGFNLLWSLVFFGLRRIDWALGEIVLLQASIVMTARSFFRLDPPAGWLLVPYQLWATFATALNAAVWWLNH